MVSIVQNGNADNAGMAFTHKSMYAVGKLGVLLLKLSTRLKESERTQNEKIRHQLYKKKLDFHQLTKFREPLAIPL
jgi:hypothetical protein